MKSIPPNNNDMLQHLRTVFLKQKDATLFIDHQTNRELSYDQSLAASQEVAQELKSLGVDSRAKVSIVAENSLEYLILLLGIWHVGACAVPLNPQLAASHIYDIVEATEPSLILTDLKHLQTCEEICKGIEIISIGCAAEKHGDNETLKACLDISNAIDKGITGAVTPEGELFSDLDQDEVFMIVFTSGSTAAPKGVQISLRNLVSNEYLFGESIGFDEKSRFAHFFPMSYLAGTHNLFLLPISMGASIVVLPGLSGATLYEFWEIVKEKKINTLWFTSTMLSMLLKIDDGADLGWLADQMRHGIVGMAPLTRNMKQDFEERFGFFLNENFALSETTFISSTVPGRDHTKGSLGFIYPEVSVSVCSASDRTRLLADGEEGELLIQSPYLMKGYCNAQPEDEMNFCSEGFYTGDLGFVSGGELFLTGRKKDLIIRGGINISPALVEAVVAEIPGIAEVSVVGIEDPNYGEEVAAAIVLTKEAKAQAIDRKAFANFLKGKLAHFQQPKIWVTFDQIPLGLTGKPDKKQVAKLIRDST